MSDLSKHDALLHKSPSGTKVPRLNKCRYIILLSKIAYQMWHDHLFSQRKKATERAVEVGAGDYREEGR